MERRSSVRRLSCSDVPIQLRRSSDLSATEPPRRSFGNHPAAPSRRSRLADPSCSSISSARAASAGPTSMAHASNASSSSLSGNKIQSLGGKSSVLLPRAASLRPQLVLASGGGDINSELSLDDHLYDADNSSGGQSTDLDAQPLFSSLSTRVKSCDVYIGTSSHEPSLIRFANWLIAELQLCGVMCFASDRSRYTDAHAHCVAREAINSASFGILFVTTKTFSSPYGMEELKLFLERRNLMVVFFGLRQEECIARDIIERRGELWQQEGGFLWEMYGGLEREWKDAVNRLSSLDCKLEAHANNWRNCIMDAVAIVGKWLRRSAIIEKVMKWKESAACSEIPFSRNNNFVGREKELLELELILFGYIEEDERPEIRIRRSFERGLVMRNDGGIQSLDLKGKEKEPLMWKGSADERENNGRKTADRAEAVSSTERLYKKGIACIHGESGIGKTELILEFAYKFAQRYKRVFWIGGEARYLRKNYLNLLSALGIDLGIEGACFPDGRRLKGFEWIEERAIYCVKKELMRNIPFLIVIDNLEGENDWWDQKNLRDILPPLGGETHVIISTRLSHVMDIEPMKLLYLSAAEALMLMKGNLGYLPREEVSALKAIEEKVGRIPAGLAIVRAILSEMSIRPTKLLDAIRCIRCRDLAWIGGQDPILRYNPGMVQLLDFCFAIFDIMGSHGSFASQLVEACGWFAPSPIPVNLLVAAASLIRQNHENDKTVKRWLQIVPCMRVPQPKQLEVKAIDILVRLQVAKFSTNNGFIHFHDMIRLYARKRGSSRASHALVQAISHFGSPDLHSEHIWAASFLLFNFGSDPAVVRLEVQELIVFIRKCVLPLAWFTSTITFRRAAALELLQQAVKALEAARPPQVLQPSALEKASRWRLFKERSSMKIDSHLYDEFIALQVTLLETITKLSGTGPTTCTAGSAIYDAGSTSDRH